MGLWDRGNTLTQVILHPVVLHLFVTHVWIVLALRATKYQVSNSSIPSIFNSWPSSLICGILFLRTSMHYNSSPPWIFLMFKLSQVINTNQFLVALDWIPVVTKNFIDFWKWHNVPGSPYTVPAQIWNHAFPLDPCFPTPSSNLLLFFNIEQFLETKIWAQWVLMATEASSLGDLLNGQSAHAYLLTYIKNSAS